MGANTILGEHRCPFKCLDTSTRYIRGMPFKKSDLWVGYKKHFQNFFYSDIADKNDPKTGGGGIKRGMVVYFTEKIT